jgi:hypothetical protein
VADALYLNVPAHFCSAGVGEQGRRLVHYQGDAFAIIGFYFARNQSDLKKRTLMYILRPFSSDGPLGLVLAE